MSEENKGHVFKGRMLHETRQIYDKLPLGQSFSTLTFWTFWPLLGTRECYPLYCRVFSSKPGLY